MVRPKFSTILLLLIFTSCSNPKSEKTEKKSVEEDQGGIADVQLVDIHPVDSLNGKFVYEIHGFQFFTPSKWGVQEFHGPDFTVTSLKSENGNQFSCYFGWHPSYPDPIQYQLSKWSDQSIQKEISKSGYYKSIVEVYFENGLKADSTHAYIKDSMYLEVYRLKTKDIWIRKPLFKRKGPIDIAVVFHSDSIETKLHVFGESNSLSESKRLTDVVQSIEKL